MLKIIVLLLNYFVGYQFLYVVIVYLISGSEELALYFNVLIAFIVNLLLTASLLQKDAKETKAGALVKNAIKTTGLMFAILLAVSIGLNLIGITTDSANQKLLEDLFTSAQYKNFVVATILIFAPLVEESVFRYALRAALPKKLRNGVFFIFLSAICFGFVHISTEWWDSGYFDVTNLVIYSILGLLLALNYKKNNFNIIYPLTVHLLYNGVQLCLMMMIL